MIGSKRRFDDDCDCSSSSGGTDPRPNVDNWLSLFKNMPESVQNEALDALIPICKQSQIRQLQLIIAPYFQIDFLTFLPKEIALLIVAHLSPYDLVVATQVSYSWKRLVEDKLVWEEKRRQYSISEMFPPNLCRRENWPDNTETDWCDPLRKHFYAKHGSSTATSPKSFTLLSNSAKHFPTCLERSRWKAIYLRNLCISKNWRFRRPNAICNLKGHDEHVITCLKLRGDLIVTGSDDATLRVWSVSTGKVDKEGRHLSMGRFETNKNSLVFLLQFAHSDEYFRILTIYSLALIRQSFQSNSQYIYRPWRKKRSLKCLHVLSGHIGGVWALQLSQDGKTAISGSTDRTVRVWDIEKGIQKYCLNGHTSTVRCMSLRKNILVTGSRDCSVKVWNIDKGCCMRTLFGHDAAVRCVKFDGTIIVSGAYDHNIHVWDAKDGALIHILEGHTDRVYSIHYASERSLLISGSLDTTIRVWNVKTGECTQTLIGHHSLTSGMKLRDNILVSANADSTIKVWNILDGSCIHTFSGPNKHESAVTGLRFLSNGLVATSGDDGFVKLWDIKEGNFVCDLVCLNSNGSGGCVWRMKATPTLMICAVGSRNGTEDTKLILMDFDAPYP